jgi:WD40 repeat protein
VKSESTHLHSRSPLCFVVNTLCGLTLMCPEGKIFSSNCKLRRKSKEINKSYHLSVESSSEWLVRQQHRILHPILSLYLELILLLFNRFHSILLFHCYFQGKLVFLVVVIVFRILLFTPKPSSADGELRIWDTNTKRCLHTSSVHKDAIVRIEPLGSNQLLR